MKLSDFIREITKSPIDGVQIAKDDLDGIRKWQETLAEWKQKRLRYAEGSPEWERLTKFIEISEHYLQKEHDMAESRLDLLVGGLNPTKRSLKRDFRDARTATDALLYHDVLALSGRNVLHLVGAQESLLQRILPRYQTFNLSLGGVTFDAILGTGLSSVLMNQFRLDRLTQAFVGDLVTGAIGDIIFESIRYMTGNQIVSPMSNYMLETGVKGLAALTMAGPIAALTAIGSVTTVYVIRELRNRSRK